MSVPSQEVGLGCRCESESIENVLYIKTDAWDQCAKTVVYGPLFVSKGPEGLQDFDTLIFKAMLEKFCQLQNKDYNPLKNTGYMGMWMEEMCTYARTLIPEPLH